MSGPAGISGSLRPCDISVNDGVFAASIDPLAKAGIARDERLSFYFGGFVDGFLSSLKGGDLSARSFVRERPPRTWVDDLRAVGNDMNACMRHLYGPLPPSGSDDDRGQTEAIEEHRVGA